MTYSNKTLLFLSAFSVLMIAFSGFQAKAQTLIAPSFLSGDSFTTGVTGFITAGEPGENMTFATELVCRACGKTYPLEARAVCDACGTPLDIHYDYEAISKN